MLAHPLETIHVKSSDVKKRILALAVERGAQTIVVGMPRNMDGSYGAAATKSKEFIEALRSSTEIKVIAWDERLTTVSAQRSLHEAGKNTKKQRPIIDQVAAQIILQCWLDSVS